LKENTPSLDAPPVGSGVGEGEGLPADVTEEHGEEGGDVDGEAVDVDGEALESAPASEIGEVSHDGIEVDGEVEGDNDDSKSSVTVSVAAPTGESIAPSDAGTHDQGEPDLLPPEPAADRISISYARNTRRMVIDAEVVQKVLILRSEGRIEITVALEEARIGPGEHSVVDEFRLCKGVLVSCYLLPIFTELR
jgi:hypothetical protein